MITFWMNYEGLKDKKYVNMLFDNIVCEGHTIIMTDTSCKWYEGKKLKKEKWEWRNYQFLQHTC
jgi:hypothetical protein